MATPKDSDHLKIAKDIFSAINHNDLSHMAELYAKDAVHEVIPLHESVKGRDNMVAYMRDLKAAFPDMKATIEHQVAAGDEVVTEFRCTGTHQGPLRALGGQPLQPTGRTFDVPMCQVARFGPGGEVIQSREYWDMTTMLSQLGVS